MENSKSLMRILEQLRVVKGFSVAKLCEDIISERTYYRYLNDEVELKFYTYEKLLLRLKTNLNDVLYFAVNIEKGAPAYERFTYRVQTRFFEDIVPIYNEVLTYEPELLERNVLLKTYINKYRYLTNEITYETYLDSLKQSISTFEETNSMNIYVTDLYSLYLLEDRENLQSIENVIDSVINLGPSATPLYQMFIIDNVVTYCMNSNYINTEKLNILVNRLEQLARMVLQKFYFMRVLLFKCYLKKLNMEDYNHELHMYLINTITLLYGEEQVNSHKQVKDLFNVDAVDFINKNTKKYLLNRVNILK